MNFDNLTNKVVNLTINNYFETFLEIFDEIDQHVELNKDYNFHAIEHRKTCGNTFKWNNEINCECMKLDCLIFRIKNLKMKWNKIKKLNLDLKKNEEKFNNLCVEFIDLF